MTFSLQYVEQQLLCTLRQFFFVRGNVQFMSFFFSVSIEVEMVEIGRDTLVLQMYFTNKMNCQSNSDFAATESSALLTVCMYARMHVPLHICMFVRLLYVSMFVCACMHT